MLLGDMSFDNVCQPVVIRASFLGNQCSATKVGCLRRLVGCVLGCVFGCHWNGFFHRFESAFVVVVQIDFVQGVGERVEGLLSFLGL